MGIFRRIAQMREEQILSHAEPYLEGDEEVVHWVRAARTEGRGRGLLFLTTERVILHWTRGEEDSGHAQWEHIEAWGINTDARGAPFLRSKQMTSSFALRCRCRPRAWRAM